MDKAKRENIIRRIKDEGVRFIRLQFTDIFGQMKNVTITASQIEKTLDNEMTIDGSSIEGFVRIEESDMRLFPDLDSFSLLPWHDDGIKVARFICDVHNHDGSPFAGDPRYVLKRAINKAAELGYTCNIGPELEFFLFHLDDKGRPTTHTGDEAGYFDLAPLDRGESARQDICLALEDMGFEIETSHHELAGGQHEIDFKHAGALETADRIMTFKLAVKTLAQRHKLHATFMPKPIFNEAGNGMHVNISLNKNGDNVFYDPKGDLELSKEAYSFIAGLLEHVRGMTAITNPLVNSYKRLVPGFEAPCYLSWSASNRSVLIRVPAARGKSTRLELRSPDPACNPYLALALCLRAGLDGIERGLEPPAEIPENIFTMSPEKRKAMNVKSLPASLEEALACMQEDALVLDTLGEHVWTYYLRGKQEEWKEYSTRVSSWEVDKYLVMY
ncbi:MAG: type I glutamate--ammonia ligase [Christensenellaceae bacterium]|nr:type I glutamate--ammonia ligase [Christensenellaceae bacterium]